MDKIRLHTLTKPILAGFSKTLDEQLKEVLDVVGSALKRVNSNHKGRTEALHEHDEVLANRRAAEAGRRQQILLGVFHDPRLDSIAGNGVMSELGIGDERLDDFFDNGAINPPAASSQTEQQPPRVAAPANDLSGLPIVVLKNYDAKGATKREPILEVLANWSASLIENKVHLIQISSC